MNRHWKISDTKLAYEDKRLKVMIDKLTRADGEQREYSVVELGDAVYILAVDSQKRFVFIQQQRPILQQVTVEIPAGGLPAGVDPLKQAAAELWEEAGIVAGNLELMGDLLANPARLRRHTYIVLATELDLTAMSTKGQENEESIEAVLLLDQAEIVRRLEHDELVDAISLAALNLYWSKYGFPEV
jgi:8-oxo-dGTP pyrophosphatase MutT (NUDIX family)